MAITMLHPNNSECGGGVASSNKQRLEPALATMSDPDLLTRTSWTDAHVALVQIKKVSL